MLACGLPSIKHIYFGNFAVEIATYVGMNKAPETEWKSTSMKDNINGRQHQCKTTSMEDYHTWHS